MSSDRTAMEERRHSFPLCGAKMTPPRCASYLTTVDDPTLPIMSWSGT